MFVLLITILSISLILNVCLLCLSHSLFSSQLLLSLPLPALLFLPSLEIPGPLSLLLITSVSLGFLLITFGGICTHLSIVIVGIA